MIRRAFTLLELMAVVAILGLIGSAVGVSLREAAERSRSVTARQQLITFDADCRMLARSHGGGTITFDLFEQQASFTSNAQDADQSERSQKLAAPIQSVGLVGQSVSVSTIPLSPLGVSPSYVVELEPIEGSRPLRLLFAGGTGFSKTLEEGVYADSYPH